jgi:hypothetical protein
MTSFPEVVPPSPEDWVFLPVDSVLDADVDRL